ncbi:chorismate mutase [Candidatus Woesearchaeota archaeon CG11_big_fil_rev_8_21_14_0_20_43_8]|nr:MAG: chorismate mutase [Candidatus Woesearchaeota archaeon CG11_big_fil_rev_8_21_14_0_20_43_8]PIO05013.1 MAG: chorismate mutase [Candidatus Woesearchaeota archaeon CG08_land_8_20_14_0_20_43_7]
MGLEDLRKEIDLVDNDILELLSKRRSIVRQIAEIKKMEGLSTFDARRETKIKAKLKEKASGLGLDQEFILRLFDEILKNSREEQEKEG